MENKNKIMKIMIIIFYFLDWLLSFYAIGLFISTGKVFYAIETGIVIFLLFVVIFVVYHEYVRTGE